MSLERMYVYFLFSGEICCWAAADSEQLLKRNKAAVTPCNMQGKFKFKQSWETVLAHFDGYILRGDIHSSEKFICHFDATILGR